MYGGVSVIGNKTSQVEELLCGERLSEPEPMSQSSKRYQLQQPRLRYSRINVIYAIYYMI